jgi:hypothetical protein
MRVVNRSSQAVAFRDDAGKHVLKPRQSIEVKGDHHLPHILSLPGVAVAKS